ncbi:MAG TPA: hypothetical protein VL307_11995, partial [Chitinophagaceae bacterium]|nr:hypothetical protein [Chitinophagaceae bacterium]
MISHLATHAQTEFAHWNKAQLVLDNGIVHREIALPQDSGQYGTSLYRTTDTANGFFDAHSPDFSFTLNQQSYAGAGHWLLLGIERCHDSLQGSGATVQLQSADKKLQLYINYLLYPGLPVIRKSLRIQNLGQDTVALEAVNVEQLSLTKYFPNTYSWVFSDYGRRRSPGAYESNKQDALVILHNPSWQQGIVMGNEAPGVMKRTSVFWEAPEICIGLTGT